MEQALPWRMSALSSKALVEELVEVKDQVTFCWRIITKKQNCIIAFGNDCSFHAAPGFPLLFQRSFPKVGNILHERVGVAIFLTCVNSTDTGHASLLSLQSFAGQFHVWWDPEAVFTSKSLNISRSSLDAKQRFYWGRTSSCVIMSAWCVCVCVAADESQLCRQSSWLVRGSLQLLHLRKKPSVTRSIERLISITHGRSIALFIPTDVMSCCLRRLLAKHYLGSLHQVMLTLHSPCQYKRNVASTGTYSSLSV